jgi:hypothetical protein
VNAERPTLVFILPFEGAMRITSNVTNQATTDRLIDWLVGSDARRSDVVAAFVRDMRAIDDGEDDLRPQL